MSQVTLLWTLVLNLLALNRGQRILAITLGVGMLLCVPLAAQFDETLSPDGDSSSDGSTSCDAVPAATIDDDPDSPDGDPSCSAGVNCTGWCAADNNNTNWSFTVTMGNPTAALDTSADAQQIAFYVQSYDEGQTGEPTIRVDIYDGTGCADLHESGSEVTLTDAGYPAIATENWTAAGLSSGNDVCLAVVCTKTGGGGGARNSCNIDAIEWRVVHAAAGGEEMMVIGEANVEESRPSWAVIRRAHVGR